MANFLFCMCVFRIVLPILLTLSIVFRPSLFSAVYLILFLFLPFTSTPSVDNMRRLTGIYLKILLGISVLNTLAQIVFQMMFLLGKLSYADFLMKWKMYEKILRHVGLVVLDGLSLTTAVAWVIPEIIMFVGSIVIYITCKKLTIGEPELRAERGGVIIPKYIVRKSWQNMAVSLGKYLCLSLLCVAASLKPSVQGGLYFLIFISASTWWACYKTLQRGFAIVLRCLMVIIVVHISALYAFQFQWTQELIESNNSYIRYFGLTSLVVVNCNNGGDPRELHWADWDLEWDTYLNPIVLMWLYYTLAAESKHLLLQQFQRRDGYYSAYGRRVSFQRAISDTNLAKQAGHEDNFKHDKMIKQSSTLQPKVKKEKGKPSETKIPVRSGLPPRKHGSSIKISSDVDRDSMDSVTQSRDEIPTGQRRRSSTILREEKPTLLDNLIYEVEFLIQVIIRSSYIATNIIMMYHDYLQAWSIRFHSWITFVLLLWANILWMIPNQRRAMLSSTPFLVFYGLFLLISGYIFSMDLNDNELPEKIAGFDLASIGFEKNKDLPCIYLLEKCLFMSMFWISMRQYMKERQEAKQTSVPREETMMSKTMEIIGKYAKRFFTKFWIWIVASTLLAVAMIGDRMTSFRIVYMALFLFFILSFQLSFRIWRKLLFGFWLIVISYSMLTLVLVYSYQFKNIQEYWTVFLHIPKQQQLDIGLEEFESRELFIKLAIPTFLVIITIIQLQYFHKDFMEISEPRSNGITKPEDSSTLVGINEPTPTIKRNLGSHVKFDLTNMTNISQLQLKERMQDWWKEAHHLENKIYLFLEIHLPKIVLLLAMMMCVYDKCAMYLAIVILITLTCRMGRPMYSFAINTTSVLISLMVLARMMYQIQYIEHEKWDVKCTFGLFSGEEVFSYNNAEWLGFRKTGDEVTLPQLVEWNIIYILAVTLWSVVLVRQNNYRRGSLASRQYVMFPRIKRSDADKNLKNCLKYLLNYGFYKFGLEICLIAIVATIGYRLDVYAVIYGIWLCLFLVMSRRVLSKVWCGFVLFLVCAIPFQYFMLIGLPPTDCIGVSLTGRGAIFVYRREWLFIMNLYNSLPGEKLLFDFIVLLLASRQAIVFRIESRNAGLNYSGGSNESIIHHFEEKDFVNPVPDFITYCRSYLDIAKRTFFLGFLWITVAIVFLTGTNRVSLFSSFYLIASFLLLGQGSDLYLRPIRKILHSWNWLLGYNVAVILTKLILHFYYCVYMDYFKPSPCWFVHLMAIGCGKKVIDLSMRDDSIQKVECIVPSEYVIEVLWDSILFGFLIIQRRILNSYNFFHIINETKATTILASRGAELIEELRERILRKHEESERRVLEKIKVKMDKIKANQQKLQGPNFQEPPHHDLAIRSGDYYMFDDDEEEEEEELAMIEEQPSSEELQYEIDKVDSNKPTLTELLTTAIKTNIGTALRSSDIEIHRRSSRAPSQQQDSKSTRSQMSSPPSAPTTVDGQRRSVVVIDPKAPKNVVDKQEQESQSGTNRDEVSELSEPNEDTKCQKVINFLVFLWVVLESAMLSLTRFLNKFSGEFRYVLQELNKEKKVLKEKTDYKVGLRLGKSQNWHPVGSYNTFINQNHQVSRNLPDNYEKREMTSADQPTIMKLLLAVWNLILSHSDIMCYFMIILNQMESASFLSLPLPLMLFFWGTLSIPRPAKTFWIIVTAYTETIVVIKCVFQFEALLWNPSQDSSPFFPPRIIGIERRPNYALWDLLLLLIIFFHRFVLKTLGLWQSTYYPAVILADGEYKVKRDELEVLETDPTALASDLTLVSYSSRVGRSRKRSLVSSGSVSISRHRNTLQGPRGTPNFLPSYTRTILKYRNAVMANRSGAIIPATAACVENESDLQQLLLEESEETTEGYPIVSIQTEQVDPCSQFNTAFRLGVVRYANSIKLFFKELVNSASRIGTDVYSYMFLCDFFNFFVILFGYSSFSPHQSDEGVSSYLEDNKIPVLFLLMLILQFAIIIVDRAIYLRKDIVAKIVFQFIQIVILHIWLFISYPIIIERGFNSVLPPQIYYMVKCLYLLLSAYQIRCGYPTRISGNFLCKDYNYLNRFLFQGFLAVPFLFELRTILDWMWTDTSMTIFDWIKMEDIFQCVYELKCSRYCEDLLPLPRGQKAPPIVKYFIGLAAFAVLMVIIWFPLVFFSIGTAVGKFNVPYAVSIALKIEPYGPIYQTSVQSNSIFSFSKTDMNKLLMAYDHNKVAQKFLNNYESGSISAVLFSTNSATVWSISPPVRDRMLEEIRSSNPIKVQFQYQISHRTGSDQGYNIITDEINIDLKAFINGTRNPVRDQLLKMINSTTKGPPVLLENIFPKFIKVRNKGTAEPILQLMDTHLNGSLGNKLPYLTINRRVSNSTPEKEWWEVKEACQEEEDLNFSNYSRKPFRKLPYVEPNCSTIVMYTFNDKLSPSALGFITTGGIISAYTLYFFVVFRFVRSLLQNTMDRAWYRNTPNVDRIYALMNDVYIVRQFGHYDLEEDLFAKLIFAFRSRELYIKLVRPFRYVPTHEAAYPFKRSQRGGRTR